MKPRRPYCRVAGAWMQPWTRDALVAWTTASALRGRRRLLGNHNMHSLALLDREPGLHRFFDRCDAVFIDGMPLILLGRLQGHPFVRRHRNTPFDWLHLVVERLADAGATWCHVGGEPATISRGLDGMLARGRVRRLPSTVVLSGYFDQNPGSAGWQATIDAINRCRPALLTVGMGMPRQEMFLASAIDQLEVGVAMSIGGWFDLHVHDRRQPPRWMGRCGLEWVHRVACEPRRVGGRYLVEPWGLMPRLISDLRRRGWRR